MDVRGIEFRKSAFYVGGILFRRFLKLWKLSLSTSDSMKFQVNPLKLDEEAEAVKFQIP
jgi:hypothetical protein